MIRHLREMRQHVPVQPVGEAAEVVDQKADGFGASVLDRHTKETAHVRGEFCDSAQVVVVEPRLFLRLGGGNVQALPQQFFRGVRGQPSSVNFSNKIRMA